MHLPEHFSEGVALLHREFRVCYATLVDAVHLEHLHVQDRHPGPILRSTAVHCTAPQHQHCTALRRCTMHCTAHTTRATRECASMHTRTWHGRARAWTHLGTQAGAALATRAHSSGRQPRTVGGVLLWCPQHSAHDANNTHECASMRTRAMGERGRTLARELALPHYCLPGQHSAWDRVQNQNRADASEREGRAPAGAHSTAHTTRATRECTSMHTRTWRGRARARTHLGTRAGAGTRPAPGTVHGAEP